MCSFVYHRQRRVFEVNLSRNLSNPQRKFVDALRLFKITVSFGSCNSLVELPCLLSHASIPKDQRTLPEDLIRMSIGIEDIEDILGDISKALKKAS